MKNASMPAGWCAATIMDVASPSGGGTPPKADASYWSGGELPWVSPKDMKVFLVRGSEDRVTPKALNRLTLIPSDSVLVVVRSGILAHTLPVSINMIPVTINQDMRAFVPGDGVDARYVAWQLVSNGRDILDRCSKDGTTVASIEGPALAGYPFAVAPQVEQSRIVEKLEELLSDLDVGVAELKAAQRKLTQYRQSLLKAAVEGALTADWRAARAQRGEPQESGAELLQRILSERRARWEAKRLAKFDVQGKTSPKDWRAKYPEPVSPDAHEQPTLPEGWAWACVDQLSIVGTGVTPLRSNAAYFRDGTLPWVTSGALNGESVTTSREFVTNIAVADCRLDVYPVGTLLVAMYGEGKTRGKCAELLIPATINQAIAAIVLEGEAQGAKEYLKLFLLNSYEHMRGKASGGVQPNLNLQIIKTLVLPLPPIAEQIEISNVLNEQMLQMHAQMEAVDHALKQSAAQRKNILKAAFAGQLVPQDPNDEPASVLLQRIRAERIAAGEKRMGKAGRKMKERS